MSTIDTGRHVLLDLYECDVAQLDDSTLIAQLLRGAAEAAGATVLQLVTHHFEPNGVTGFALLSAASRSS